jgi:carboxyl-terminal processing protease
MFNISRRTSTLILAVLIVGGAFFFGLFLGEHNQPLNSVSGVYGVDSGKPGDVDFSPFWQAWKDIQDNFVQTSTSTESVDNQQKVWGAIAGLTASLGDPYTVFFPPSDAAVFESEISGNFEGVGMEVGIRDDGLTVIAPLKGTPAEKAGVKAGDKIVKIDGKVTAALSADEAIKLIRGQKGTTVTLTVIRDGGEPQDIKVVRDVIDIPTIKTETKDGVFIISLYNFSATSPNLFRQALREFADHPTDKLIIDLRGNPGGYLEAALDMASWFLPAGKPVVIQDFSSSKDQEIYRSKGYDIFGDNIKVAVLIDRGSASASEILAGALSSYKKAILVGEKSFGKGSVQEVFKITPDTALKVTIARWLTPDGISISQNGLTPDVPVKFEAGKSDTQLQKAIEVLKDSDMYTSLLNH